MSSIQHVVVAKLKAGITEDEINNLYKATMDLGKLNVVRSVTAGANLGPLAEGYNYCFTMTLTDLKGYQEHPEHVYFRDHVFSPLITSKIVFDYEFPRSAVTRALAGGQHWDPARCNEDLQIDGDVLSVKGEANVWRTAVTSLPIHDKAYVEFLIENNPRPAARGIEIGVVGHDDLVKIAEPGRNFTSFSGLAWSCNGGAIGNMLTQLPTMPHKEWKHDETVGVFVDLEKGVMQYFLDRKKIGPAIHLKNVTSDLFFAISINTGKVCIKADFAATCPKVFIA